MGTALWRSGAPALWRSGALALWRFGALALWRFGASARSWRHNGAITSIQIKDVPEHTHAVLRRRAAAAHQSLQEYLRSWLVAEAARPTLDEVLDRAGGHAAGSVTLSEAVETLRHERAGR